ncbi:alpha/beta fold hydrolase [Aquidulcibacter sp.]|uniref:alpha/beta fold hydrolase n=1 Tax=Aquidulcibacter sp. TaxID=2052990 RepID=UPI0025B7ED44|nr:alpha/beta fold hydrolase [Aquidulcibacter sp.]MCA3693727.1 alpha/beta fold hydrolase [Aquidulcibacter sp.]
MDYRTARFKTFDGLNLAWTETGSPNGRPTLVLHGFLASAHLNWIEPGLAAAMATTGRRILLPDLRGHGQSDAPTDPAAYPKDALPKDQEVLLAQLGITDFDLVGYSLGARTAVRLLARGHTGPTKVFLGGMGEAGITTVGTRKDYFEDGIRNGANAQDPRAGAFIQNILKQRGMSPEAALGVLSTQVSTSVEQLAKIKTPVLVVNGDQDRDNGDPVALAAALGNGSYKLVPGNHLSAVAEPAFRDALVAFLRT